MDRQQIMRDMQREAQLCTASRFIEDAAGFRRIEIGQNPTGTPQATIQFDITPQPLFHKNIELLKQTLEDYVLKGYKLFILADSAKQQQRLREIVEDKIPFTDVSHTLHAGFTDNEQRVCFFTDHQIFDRFHKYSLRSDTARAGKMALSMKELQEMEVGDYLVHVDYGVGKFGGLVRLPLPSSNGKETSYQEVIRIIYQHNDKVDVSIHSLYKISKYE